MKEKHSSEKRSRPIGKKLAYSIRMSDAVSKQVQAFHESLRLRPAAPLTRVEVSLYPDKIEIASDQGFSTKCDIATGTLLFEAGQNNQVIALPYSDLTDRLQRAFVNTSVTSIMTRRTLERDGAHLRLKHYKLIADSDEFEVWTCPQLFVSDWSTRLLCTLWFGKLPVGSLQGIPADIILRDPDDPDIVSFRCLLQSVDSLYEDKKLEIRARIANAARSNVTHTEQRIEVGPIALATSVLSGAQEPQAMQNSPYSLLYHYLPAGVNLQLQYLCKMGVVYRNGFLTQLENYVNTLARVLPSIAGDLDRDHDVIRMPIPFWTRLEPFLDATMTEKQLNALRDIIVGLHLLSGGEPVKVEDQAGGLSTDEIERWNTIRQVVATIRYDSSQGFHIASDEYSKIDSIHKDAIRVVVTNIWIRLLDAANHNNLAVPPDLITSLVLIYMFGYASFDSFGTILSLLQSANLVGPTPADPRHRWFKPFDPSWALLHYDQSRAEQFVQAQLRALLDANVEIDVSGTKFTAGIPEIGHVELGPLENINVSLLDDVVTTLRHEAGVIAATIVISRFSLTYPGRFHLSNPFHFAVITGGVSLVVTDVGGSIVVNLNNVRIPIVITLPAVTDDNGSGYGLCVGLDTRAQDAAAEAARALAEQLARAGRLSEALIRAAGDAAEADVRAHQIPLIAIDPSEVIANIPFPFGEMIVGSPNAVGFIIARVGIELQKVLQSALPRLFAEQVDNHTRRQKVFAWPDLLKLADNPAMHMLNPGPADQVGGAWALIQALWATPRDIGLGEMHLNVGELVLDDISNLGYVCTQCALTKWLSELMKSSRVYDDKTAHARTWFEQSGVALADLASYSEPEEAQADQTSYSIPSPSSQVGSFIWGYISANCGPIPPVATPTRYYELRYTRSAPRVQLEGNGPKDTAGRYVITYDLSFQAQLKKQYVYSNYVTWLKALAVNMLIHANDPAYGEDPNSYTAPGSGEGTATSETADTSHKTVGHIGDSSSGDTGSTGYPPLIEMDCTWSIIDKEYTLKTIVAARIEISGEFYLGYQDNSDSAASLDDSLAGVMPILGLTPKFGQDGNPKVVVEPLSFEFEPGFAEGDKSKLRTYILETLKDAAVDLIKDSDFGKATLSGVYYLDGKYRLLDTDLADPFHQARLVQTGTPLGPGDFWNADIAFQYFVRNGHLIWPVDLEFDLEALI